MKRTLVLLAFISTFAAARGDLVVEQKIESAMQNGNMTMKVKGEKIRVDMPTGPAGAMSSIMDLTTGDSVTLMHGQKMVVKVSGAQTKQMMEMMKKQTGAGDGKTETPKPTATGKTEKVGAFNAEIYTWAGNGMTQTLWVSKDFPNFAKIKPQLDKVNESAAGGMARGMAPDQSALPGMVVKSQMEMAGMKVTTTILSVKEEAVDAAAFEAPKDYQEMAQPGGVPSAPVPAPK